jgi:carbon monoxide dehydrogenase subunit G
VAESNTQLTFLHNPPGKKRVLINLEGNFIFRAPRQEIWEMLMDPEVIARAIPGCEEFRAEGDDVFKSKLTIGIAAVKGAYAARIALLDKKPPESFTLKVEGTGARGFLNGEVSIRLESQGNETVLHYVAENHIGGQIAAIGQRIIGPAAKVIVRQGFKSLEKQLTERQSN